MLRIPGSVVISNNKIEDDIESVDVGLESRSTNSIYTGTGTGTGTGIGFISKLKVFKDPQFLSLTIAQLVSSSGLFIPLYYLQSKSTKKQKPTSIDFFLLCDPSNPS